MEFFCISDAFAPRSPRFTIFIDDVELVDDEPILRNLYDLSDSRIVFKKYMGGNTLYDLLPTGWGTLFALHKRVIDKLIENDLTGWSAQPITFELSGQHFQDEYFIFSVTGRAGPFDESDVSQVFVPRLMPHMRDSLEDQNYKVNESTWDGSDFFLIDGTKFLIVTEIVRDIIMKNKFKNISIKNVKKLVFNTKII